MKFNIIAAVSLNGVLGRNNTLPWPMDKYPEDMKWFRSQTANSTVIMGRKTFDSIGKPLPKRRNIVISRTQSEIAKRDVPVVEWVVSLKTALELADKDEKVWIIGGSSIYQDALAFENVNEVYLTTIPETITGDGLIYFPYLNHRKFKLNQTIEISAEKNLYCDVFKNVSGSGVVADGLCTTCRKNPLRRIEDDNLTSMTCWQCMTSYL